jgi:hypothetical protein
MSQNHRMAASRPSYSRNFGVSRPLQAPIHLKYRQPGVEALTPTLWGRGNGLHDRQISDSTLLDAITRIDSQTLGK